MKLDGAAADIVRDLFGTTADNVTVASVAVLVGFLIWGISIGQLYQDVYARAWRIHAGSGADQLRYTIWFFLDQWPPRIHARLGVGAAGQRLAPGASALDRRLDRLLALDSALPTPSGDSDSLAPARRATGDVRPQRDDRHLAALDRADNQPERERRSAGSVPSSRCSRTS